MIYCANCGTSLQSDIAFCPECGTKNELVKTTVPNLLIEPKPLLKTEEKENLVVSPASDIKEFPKVETPPPIQKEFCRNCGKEVTPGAFACMNCGLPPMKAFNFCPSCGSNCHQDAVVCIKCGIKLDSQPTKVKASQDEGPKKSYCRNCGKEVLSGAVACMGCGLPPGKSKNFCPACGAESHNEAIICIKCGTPFEEFALHQNQYINSSPQTTNPIKEKIIPSSQPYTPNQTNNIVVVGSQKSVGTAFLLAFLFGPLGLLYASVSGGIIMFFVGIVLFFAIPLAGAVLAWFICIIWAVAAAQNANQSALNQAGKISNNLNR